MGGIIGILWICYIMTGPFSKFVSLLHIYIINKASVFMFPTLSTGSHFICNSCSEHNGWHSTGLGMRLVCRCTIHLAAQCFIGTAAV